MCVCMYISYAPPTLRYATIHGDGCAFFIIYPIFRDLSRCGFSRRRGGFIVESETHIRKFIRLPISTRGFAHLRSYHFPSFVALSYVSVYMSPLLTRTYISSPMSHFPSSLISSCSMYCTTTTCPTSHIAARTRTQSLYLYLAVFFTIIWVVKMNTISSEEVVKRNMTEKTERRESFLLLRR
ncbi:hypothetical protein C8R43DRAFT_1041640 [Mycena crocata]|nr:hypothetical protein C8R43DRAFT_1041640 [Mycena crocata]